MNTDRILLAHGGGGQQTARLIKGTIGKYFSDPLLAPLDDGALLECSGQQVFTTDSFVVSPIIFPGGDIGRLAVAGTVNDLSVMGARPLYLSTAFIIEEGLEIATFEHILQSMKETAESCGVRIVTGDTKVVERGKCDQLFVTTCGIGRVEFPTPPSVERICPGDMVLINGPIGLHAVSVLTARNQFGLEVHVPSDVAALWPLIRELQAFDVKFMRDPTRGGIAQVLNEITEDRDFGIEIFEASLPVTPEVAGICDILGFDLPYLANEGKVIVIVPEVHADAALEVMKNHPLGKGSAPIGRVTDQNKGMVTMHTLASSQRILMPPVGELLPRIC